MLGWLASFTRSRPLVCGEISEVADERFELGIIHDGLARFIALPDCLPHCADFLAGRRRVDGDDIKATRALEQNFVNPLVSITHLSPGNVLDPGNEHAHRALRHPSSAAAIYTGSNAFPAFKPDRR